MPATTRRAGAMFGERLLTPAAASATATGTRSRPGRTAATKGAWLEAVVGLADAERSAEDQDRDQQADHDECDPEDHLRGEAEGQAALLRLVRLVHHAWAARRRRERPRRWRRDRAAGALRLLRPLRGLLRLALGLLGALLGLLGARGRLGEPRLEPLARPLLLAARLVGDCAGALGVVGARLRGLA